MRRSARSSEWVALAACEKRPAGDPHPYSGRSRAAPVAGAHGFGRLGSRTNESAGGSPSKKSPHFLSSRRKRITAISRRRGPTDERVLMMVSRSVNRSIVAARAAPHDLADTLRRLRETDAGTMARSRGKALARASHSRTTISASASRTPSAGTRPRSCTRRSRCRHLERRSSRRRAQTSTPGQRPRSTARTPTADHY